MPDLAPIAAAAHGIAGALLVLALAAAAMVRPAGRPPPPTSDSGARR